MTISYIIPACNAEVTLQRAIKSICDQTIETNDKIEVIVVENGSTDKTLEVCQKAVSLYSCVITVSINKTGASAARNQGLQMSHGDIIAFCDADDYVEPGSIKRILRIFHENPETEVIVCGKYNVKPTGEKTLTLPVHKTEQWEAKKLVYKMLYDPSIMGSVWNKFFRRRLLENIYFDESLTHCEDLDFVFSALYGYYGTVRMETFPCYNYVYNPGSIVHCAEKLFDAESQLLYSKTYKKLLGKTKIDRKLTGLIKYTLVSNSIQNYFAAWNHKQRQLIISDIKQNLFSWFSRIYIRPKEEIFHLAALVVIGMCEVGVLNVRVVRSWLYKRKKKYE